MGSVGNASNNTPSTSLYNGLNIEGTPSNQQRADEVVRGVKDVLSDFGFDSALRNVIFNETGTLMRGEASASMNGIGDLHVSNRYLNKEPSDSKGYFVNDTHYGTGAHEAGHVVVNELLKTVPIDVGETNPTASRMNLARATARHDGKLEHAILKEAKSRYGASVRISGYGSKKEIEKVAEAVSDVYSNKNNANPYSKVIVGVMKDIKSGKFRPKISVTKRQMGL